MVRNSDEIYEWLNFADFTFPVQSYFKLIKALSGLKFTLSVFSILQWLNRILSDLSMVMQVLVCPGKGWIVRFFNAILDVEINLTVPVIITEVGSWFSA